MCALNLPNSPCIQSVSENETAAFMVYPNPTNGAFVISAGAGIESMVVYDSVGQMVERMVGLNATQINVDEHLSPGLYVIEVLSKGRKTTQRIVIQ
jgi:hypothetical protein